MKRVFKILFSATPALLLLAQMNLFTACQDDMAADSYYTFTGETMGDYLNNHENMALFKQIAERGNRMNMLGARGKMTLFPPTNEAVQAYLDEQGYASVEDIPVSFCDTLVKTCMLDNQVIYSSEFGEETSYYNPLRMYTVIRTDGDHVDDNNIVQSIINNNAAILNELKDDTVENGVVHPVDKMLLPITSKGMDFLDIEEKYAAFSIYYEALKRTEISLLFDKERDEDYDTWKHDYPEFHEQLYSGHKYYCPRRPFEKKYGFTLFMVPDAILCEKYADYGFEAFTENMTAEDSVSTMNHNISCLYNLAVEKYGDQAALNNFGITDELKETYWKDNDEAYTSQYNPLNMFMRYHVLDRMFAGTDKIVNQWNINETIINPTDWVNTLLPHSTMKLEACYKKNADSSDPNLQFNGQELDVENAKDLRINHASPTRYNSYQRVRGSKITVPTDVENAGTNIVFYYIDEVVAYDETMRNNTMNCRIRFDMYTLWPEFTNNDMRMQGNPWTDGNNPENENGSYDQGWNYYIPSGYLDNTEVSENTTFFAMRPHSTYWNMHGDELNFLGSSYDVCFRLPAVPAGDYELRLGFAAMADRGIAQIYINEIPQGIPLDLRNNGESVQAGGLYGDSWTSLINSGDQESMEENRRMMRNNGYYRGPHGVFCLTSANRENYKTPESARYKVGDCNLFDGADSQTRIRRKLCNVTVKDNEYMTMRVRSVWVPDPAKGCFMIDYLELVPLSICGPDGIGEDNY